MIDWIVNDWTNRGIGQLEESWYNAQRITENPKESSNVAGNPVGNPQGSCPEFWEWFCENILPIIKQQSILMFDRVYKEIDFGSFKLQHFLFSIFSLILYSYCQEPNSLTYLVNIFFVHNLVGNNLFATSNKVLRTFQPTRSYQAAFRESIASKNLEKESFQEFREIEIIE